MTPRTEVFESLPSAVVALDGWAAEARASGHALEMLLGIVGATDPAEVRLTFVTRALLEGPASTSPALRRVLQEPTPDGELRVMVIEETRIASGVLSRLLPGFRDQLRQETH